MESKFSVDMRIYTLCPSYLQSFTKFCWAVSEELRYQEKQDWRTDWLTDGSKTLYPPQLVAWGIIIVQHRAVLNINIPREILSSWMSTFWDILTNIKTFFFVRFRINFHDEIKWIPRMALPSIRTYIFMVLCVCVRVCVCVLGGGLCF